MELFPSTVSVESVDYELNLAMSISYMDNENEWNGVVYSCHINCILVTF